MGAQYPHKQTVSPSRQWDGYQVYSSVVYHSWSNLDGVAWLMMGNSTTTMMYSGVYDDYNIEQMSVYVTNHGCCRD